ncbi:MAG: hypothetical protein KDD33_07935 [Bdellovibrionales bacterium]|nr:hypothetical protein [Bdellovibrionales bacterium]
MIQRFSFFVALFLVWGCTHQPLRSYPDHWWTPVQPALKKSWEILPQEADRSKNEVILSKRNELGLLSNFAATPFVLDGKRYASLEGFWQMLKYPERGDAKWRSQVQWPYTREQVGQMVGHKAKKAGDFASLAMKKHQWDWVSYNHIKMIYKEAGSSPFYVLIRRAMQAKLEQNPKVKEVLIATKGLRLKPDHKQNPDSPKAWKYFDIWMEIRDQ